MSDIRNQNSLNRNSSILIAEDNPLNFALLEEYISAMNIRVDLAENGKIAVNKLRENSYSLVFMDIEMPEMNGIEATAEIRKFNKEIPIIAVTAYSYNELKANLKDSGFNGYITKPVNETQIQKLISSLI